MRKWSASLALIVMAAACGTADPAAIPTPTGSGDGFEFEVLFASDSLEWLDGPSPGELRLDACRWVGPAAYEFDLTWVPSAAGAHVLYVVLELIEPANDTPPSIRLKLQLDAAASFTVPVDNSQRYRHDGGEVWGFNRADLANETKGHCGGSIYGTGASSLRADLDLAPVALPTDDLSGLPLAAASVDPTDTDHPLLPLAWMARAVASLVDAYAVVEGATLDGVGVEREGTCVSLFSTFTLSDGSAVHLLQQGGCAAATPSDQAAYPGFVPPAMVEHEGWTVTVTPGSADITWLRDAAAAAPADDAASEDDASSTFSPTAWLGAYREQHPEVTVIAIFEWEDGLVAVVDNADFQVERYADPIVITPEEYRGGVSGAGCDAFGWSMSSHAGRSYIFVVAHEPGLRFDIGSEHELVWQTTADGREVGFADLHGTSVGAPTVTDADGAVVPCIPSAG